MPSKVTLGDSLLFPSNYLSHADCKGQDLTLTICKVERQELTFVGGKKKSKPVIEFAEPGYKPLVLNKTNADSIAYLHGTKAEGWIGKKITFYPTQVPFGKDIVDAIRVRESVKPKSAPAPKPKLITKAQGTALYAKVKEAGVTDEAFFKMAGVSRLGEIPLDRLQSLTDELGLIISATANGAQPSPAKPTEPPKPSPEIKPPTREPVEAPVPQAELDQWHKYGQQADVHSVNSMGIPELEALSKNHKAQVLAILKAELEIRGFTWDGQKFVQAAMPASSS